jgi:hypothetical protein
MDNFTTTRNPVEFADRLSRRRSVGIACATVIFLGIQVVARPVFTTDVAGPSEPRSYLWALNSAILALLLLPIAGSIWGRRVRQLLNDEVARHHARSGAAAGFATALGVALTLWFLPLAADLTGREVSYLIVTPSVAVAVLAFAWLEARAHRDG